MAITLDGTTGITTPGVTDTGNLSYTGTLTGGTGVVNIGSGQVYKDASGNVLLGTTSTINSAQLTGNKATNYRFNLASDGTERFGIFVDSGISALYSASTMSFTTNGTERARIDTSGNLLVGTTTNPQTTKLALQYGGTNVWGVGPNSGSATFYVLNSAGTGVYLSTGTTSWAAASDERLKTTLVPFENAAVKVCTLRAGTGRYLADEDTVSRSFLIAQDVQKVLPEAISVEDNEQKTLGLRYQEVIPLLVAAIQEQQALISSLTTRLTALENK